MRLLVRLVLLPLFCCAHLLAQPGDGSARDGLKDYMKFRYSSDQKVLAIWFPCEVLMQSVKEKDSSLSPETLEAMFGDLRGYAAFMVQVTRTDGENGEWFPTEEQIRQSARLTDPSGRVFPVITRPPGMLAEIIKTMDKRGGDTSAMSWIIFENRDAAGRPILHPLKPGSFTLTFEETPGVRATTLLWKTPLASLAETTPTCPKCHTALTSTWNFCPTCGQSTKAK